LAVVCIYFSLLATHLYLVSGYFGVKDSSFLMKELFFFPKGTSLVPMGTELVPGLGSLPSPQQVAQSWSGK